MHTDREYRRGAQLTAREFRGKSAVFPRRRPRDSRHPGIPDTHASLSALRSAQNHGLWSFRTRRTQRAAWQKVGVLNPGARLQRRRSGWRKPDDLTLAALFAECQATIGVRSSVVLRVTPDDLGPAVAGLWAPCVLVPQSVLAKASREDIEHILLHELAHVRRRDMALHWLMTAARVVHWFNPAVQLAAARASRR